MITSGTIDITPTMKIPLAGYETRVSCANEQFISKLEANYLVENCGDSLTVVLSLDTLFVGGELYRSIKRKLENCCRNSWAVNVYLIASHTHNAPMLDEGKPSLGEVDQGYMDATVDSIVAGIEDSIAGEFSAAESIDTYSGKCDASVYRRSRRLVFRSRYPWIEVSMEMQPACSMKIDNQITLICLRDNAGRPIAVVWSWPCHPTTIGNRDVVSADYPGVVREGIRNYFGVDDLAILYVPGFCGDVRAGIYAKKNLKDFLHMPFGLMFKKPSPAQYAEFCSKLCTAVALTLDSKPRCKQSGLELGSSHTEKLPLEQLMYGDTSRQCLEFHMVSFAGVKLLFVNAEVCSPYIDLLCEYPFELMSGCAQETFGYLPVDSQIANGGYEVNGFVGVFGLSGHYHDRVEKKVQEAVATGVEKWLVSAESAVA